MAIDGTKARSRAILWLGLFCSVFHIYFLGFTTMNAWSFRICHVAMAMVLILLMKPLPRRAGLATDLFLMALALATSAYLIANISRLSMMMQFRPGRMDVVVCCIGIALVIETTRRINGLTMCILAGLFILYSLFGQHLPQMFGHRGYTVSRLAAYLYSIDGVFGSTINVSSTYMILFVIFGAVLEGTGGGRLFIDLATAVFGHMRGGPAKAAILASAGMGTISGSSAGNVVTTGAFTIPLMKKIGYRSEFAGAVEAVASTGGQIMPPIMGAGAFVMAETLGIPYATVALAAIIPAILYFLSIFVMVDCEALKSNLTALAREDMPRVKRVLIEVGHLFIPLMVVLYVLLIQMQTPIRAGLYGIFTSLAVAVLRRTTRYTWRQLVDMLSEGSRGAVGVVSACACAGIIIGCLALTGLGSRMVGIITTFSGGSLLVALLLTMVVTLILGMGLPTTAAYIVCSSVVGPALIKMGLAPLPAHFFIFYFACLSAITPPVAVASYAAAGIAKCNPNTCGWSAFFLGIAAFIVPYMFVYSNALLLIGSPGIIAQASATAIFGTVFFGMAVSGWFRRRAAWPVRILLLVASLLLIDQGVYSDIIGLGLVAACFLLQKRPVASEADLCAVVVPGSGGGAAGEELS